jgi:hypothetical protein
MVFALSLGAGPSAGSLEGRFVTESIESSPAFVRGSAALTVERDAGTTAYRASLIELKAFGFEIPEPPDAIQLSGRLVSRSEAGRAANTLQLIGVYKSDGKQCFVRLTVKPSASRSVLAAGWLDCGRKKIEIGFAAARSSLASDDVLAAHR